VITILSLTSIEKVNPFYNLKNVSLISGRLPTHAHMLAKIFSWQADTGMIF
jgi:hypothetical protein